MYIARRSKCKAVPFSITHGVTLSFAEAHVLYSADNFGMMSIKTDPQGAPLLSVWCCIVLDRFCTSMLSASTFSGHITQYRK